MREEIILGYYHGEKIRLLRVDNKLRVYWGNFERNPDWLSDLRVSTVGPVPGSQTCPMWGLTGCELSKIGFLLDKSDSANSDAESLLTLDSDEASESDKALIAAVASKVAEKSWTRIKGILESQDVAFAKQNATDYHTARKARLLSKRSELEQELAEVNRQIEEETKYAGTN